MTKNVRQSKSTTKPKKASKSIIVDPDSKSIKSIATTRFTRDECLIIESFLNQFELVISNKNKAALKPVTTAIEPIVKLNQATYGKLRYKIENIISPKNI